MHCALRHPSNLNGVLRFCSKTACSSPTRFHGSSSVTSPPSVEPPPWTFGRTCTAAHVRVSDTPCSTSNVQCPTSNMGARPKGPYTYCIVLVCGTDSSPPPCARCVASAPDLQTATARPPDARHCGQRSTFNVQPSRNPIRRRASAFCPRVRTGPGPRLRHRGAEEPRARTR